MSAEEIKRLTFAVSEMDSVSRKDINYLRDLTGSVSRLVNAC